MTARATCAKCGEHRDLTGRWTLNGIAQPRTCYECQMASMMSGDYEVDDDLYKRQLRELDEFETLKALNMGGNR